MAKVIFSYKGTETEIQCNINDKMRDIYKRNEIKIGKDISKLLFLYNGNNINDNLTLNEIINEDDKRRNIINILVNENDEAIIKERIVNSNEIICPKCYENILIKIDEYKINLYNCKNNHNTDNILLNEYENNIDLSKIVCDKCKIKNKSNTYKNEFYRCNTCKINLCPLCKSNHNNNHKIINYDNKNYICEIHNKEYIKYCKNCKSNICMICLKEHKNHSIINYEDLILNEEDNKKEINKLKEYINKMNTNINDIIEILSKVKENMNKYYKIYNNIINNYNYEKINYEILYNINEFNKYNNIIIKDINEIINDININIKFKNILNLYNKINNNNKIICNNNKVSNNKINYINFDNNFNQNEDLLGLNNQKNLNQEDIHKNLSNQKEPNLQNFDVAEIENENNGHNYDPNDKYRDYPEKIVELINNIREDPIGYADLIEDSIKYIMKKEDKNDPTNIRLIFNKKVKIRLNKGEPAFREAAEILRSLSPLPPLEFSNDKCIPLPENEDELKDPTFFREQVRQIRENTQIDVFFKDLIKIPEVSGLLMIVDDTNKYAGKKRMTLLDKDLKYVGVTSKFIGKTFIAHFAFSK